MSLLTETATAYHEAGLQVLPIRYGDKRPLSSWQEYTRRPQTSGEVKALFPEGEPRNIAILGGSVSRNFLGLDFDDRRAFTRLVESAPAFARLASTAPIVRTSRGVHVYVRTPEPCAGGKIAELSLDLKAEGGYVVAPPSLHRSGQLYLFADGWKRIPEIDFDALPFPVRIFQEANPENLAPLEYGEIYEGGGFYGLGEGARHVLAGRIPTGQRSEAEARIIFTCARNGWTFPQVAELFERHARRNTHFREHASPWRYLRHVFEKASVKLATERRDVDKRIDELERAFARYPFPARTAYTDRAVAFAALSIARRTGRLEVHLSEREIAELSGITRATAGRSLARLPLRTVKTGTALAGHLFSFPIPQELPQAQEPYIQEGVKEWLITLQATDAARRGAIGKTGLAVLNSLSLTEGKPVATIAREAGTSRVTVYAKLEKLEALGILAKEGSRYRLTRKVDGHLLNEIAEAFGTKGARDRQRRQHEAERLQYRARIASKS